MKVYRREKDKDRNTEALTQQSLGSILRNNIITLNNRLLTRDTENRNKYVTVYTMKIIHEYHIILITEYYR